MEDGQTQSSPDSQGDFSSADDLRRQVLETVKRFKGNWMELGRYLNLVNSAQTFRAWDYSSFSGYCTRELRLRKQTVDKLLRSYAFLAREEPGYLKDALSGDSVVADVECVNVLRKARSRKDINEKDYGRIRQAVLEGGAEPREVGRQYRSLLAAAREEPADSREAWERCRVEKGKRVLTSLRRLRESLASERYFSRKVVDDLSLLIRRVEEELAAEPGQ